MFHLNRFTSTLAAATCLLAMTVTQAQAMTKADYKSSKSRISSEYKADKSACGTTSGNAKDICIEQAKAKEKVAYAELEFGYTAKASDGNKVLVAKAKTSYAVAKERCDDQSGNAKDICVKEAKAVEVKALADARLGKEIRSATSDAVADKRAADYKVAAEKCESLSGDAKGTCMTTAKADFGKR